MVSADASTLGGLADPASTITVEVNDEENDFVTPLTVERGEELEVEVELINKGLTDALNIEVEAQLLGYDEEDPTDSVLVGKVTKGTKGTSVTLKLTVPSDFNYGAATLRVMVSGGANEADLVVDYPLFVESQSHSVKIADVSFSPGLTVKAGKSLLTTVLVENVGDNDEEDIKVTVAVAELGVSASEYLDEVLADDKEDADEMLLIIPHDTKAGEYTVKVTVQYDDLEESVTETYTLKVVDSELVKPQLKSGKTVLATGPEMQSVAAGKTATYAVALTNDGSASKAYTIEVATGDWATASVSEKLVVLEPGNSKVVYVDLTAAEDATAGEHLASLTVKSGSDVLETVVLKADVVAPQKASNETSLRNGLEIALVVLVVLLVLLGLVIGFSRLRKDDDGEEKYY
ncbi:MAG: hypothetical protein Q7S55_01285 [Nanoarchaeota archaeon]|nr:hypothetical protein [Nanoarchaeota archaeon]